MGSLVAKALPSSGTCILTLPMVPISCNFHTRSSACLPGGGKVFVHVNGSALLPNDSKVLSEPKVLLLFPLVVCTIVPNAIVTKLEAFIDFDCF